MTEEEFLQHYGVKGMRWGIRRKRTSSSSSDSSEEARPKRLSKRQRKKLAEEEVANSAKRAKQWRKEFNKRDKMSDDELKEKINRLKLENEFDRLSKEAIKDHGKKGDNKIKKLLDMKVPRMVVDKDGNEKVDTSRTVGEIVADEAMKAALQYYRTQKAAKEAGASTAS